MLVGAPQSGRSSWARRMLHTAESTHHSTAPRDITDYIASIRQFTLITARALLEWWRTLIALTTTTTPSLLDVPTIDSFQLSLISDILLECGDAINPVLPSSANASIVYQWWTTCDTSKTSIQDIWRRRVLCAPRPVPYPLTDSSDYFMSKFSLVHVITFIISAFH
jgi:hypothetical protein